MANPRKQSKNSNWEWFEEAENSAPTHSRSARTLSAYVKIVKPTAGKSRRRPPLEPRARPEPALAREPGGETKPPARQSQPASFDHQLKLRRLSNLRAPYDYKPTAQPAPSAGSKTQAYARGRAARVKR
jgi:hypothetical protein